MGRGRACRARTRNYSCGMRGPAPHDIALRATTRDDLPSLFRFEQDPVANELAGTKPRDWATFSARLEEVLRDPGITARVIVADGELVGAINSLKQDGMDWIGYWISREHWGRGIATRAIGLMLGEVATRPLFARASAQNEASLRALLRNGFAEISRGQGPETQRHVAREVVTLRLG